jgi:hypothetical protein
MDEMRRCESCDLIRVGVLDALEAFVLPARFSLRRESNLGPV